MARRYAFFLIRQMRTLFLFILLTIFLDSCKDPLDKNFETIKDNYKLGYFDKESEIFFVRYVEKDEMMMTIVNHKIKRFGFGERFAIIERVGNYWDPGVELDTLTVTYYIVDMASRPGEHQTSSYRFGPATYEEFLLKKRELGIEDLKFTKEFKVN